LALDTNADPARCELTVGGDYAEVAARSRAHQKSEIEGREYQDDSHVHGESLPEPVSEEQQIDCDDYDCHRDYEEYGRRLASHVNPLQMFDGRPSRLDSRERLGEQAAHIGQCRSGVIVVVHHAVIVVPLHTESDEMMFIARSRISRERPIRAGLPESSRMQIG
jgi:hypothetical protein